MDGKLSKNLIIFAIIILIIIIIIVAIMILFLQDNENEEIAVSIDTSEITKVTEDKIQTINVDDKKRFFTVLECISNDLENKLYFVPLKMNMLEGANVDTYSVYGFVTDLNYQDIQYLYFIVKLDSFNSTYSIELLKENDDNIENIELDNDNLEIKFNGNNSFSYTEISDIYIIKKYINYYKIAALSNPELIYNNFLDTEYKDKKFENVDEFKEYVNNNKSSLLNMSVIKYSVEQNDNYTQYTILDNYNNYYIIKENGVMNFSILLDNYTIETEEFNEEYANASNDVKIATNIDKIFKMINNKEYKNIYENYLNSSFKENYFTDYQSFEDYINERFFDYNYLGSTSYDEQSGYYIVSVNYKDGISSAAEIGKINIIMKLNEDNSFEFSFEME